MRKTIILFALFFTALCAHAANVDATATYIYSSRHNQASIGAVMPLGINTLIGLEGKYVEDRKDDGFEDPVYSVYLPMQFDLDLVKLNLTPFYYFKNDIGSATYDDPYAYGIATQLVMNLQQDEVAELYTRAYVGVSYARQNGILTEKGNTDSTNFTQMAYTLGLQQNFYSAFTFHVAGTAYQYPDGISDVTAFRGIMDQNDLAFVQSYDVNRELGKYTLSARITRIWTEKASTLYLGYHFAEFHTADKAQHSFLVGNSFPVGRQAKVDAAYNHLQNTDGKNKRDIFFINVNISF
ncbi:MAG: hypothetical protein IKJ44_01320 [Elusimicrobiaceae bacterium]|nr:hypothetical protein [Elusimicrobiaceae bacterium]MBR3898893.1 hypothetical protein [Elusimicrobiaceae bacterium]